MGFREGLCTLNGMRWVQKYLVLAFVVTPVSVGASIGDAENQSRSVGAVRGHPSASPRVGGCRFPCVLRNDKPCRGHVLLCVSVDISELPYLLAEERDGVSCSPTH